LIARLPQQWMQLITRVPILVRFSCALLIGYLLSAGIIAVMWPQASMHSVTISTLLSLTLFTLVFPEAAQANERGSAEQQTAAAGASLACAIAGLLFGSSVAAHAQGFYRGHGTGFSRHSLHFDDPACSNLTDCYSDSSSAATTSSATAALASITTPGIMNASHSEQPHTNDQVVDGSSAWTHQVHNAVQNSTPTSQQGVNEFSGPGQQAWETFSRFAQPGSIRSHPNSALAKAGGYLAEMADNSVIAYRPLTQSGPPAIDLHGVSGCKWLRKFRIIG
jgi:hypothetical protein